jgi:hypothetical protein
MDEKASSLLVDGQKNKREGEVLHPERQGGSANNEKLENV